MKFLVFDTETTGLPKSKYAEPEDTWQFPYVVQLSWLIFNTGTNKVEALRDKIIRLPSYIKIPQRATEIHGITQEQMLEEGPHATEPITSYYGANWYDEYKRKLENEMEIAKGIKSPMDR